MKKIFSFIAMCLMALSSMAQSQLVATLTHDGTTTSFEGPNALQDALDRVNAGDLITLSAGTFSTVNAEFTFFDNFTIRGNGMEGPDATIINKNVTLVHNADESSDLKIEGVRFAGDVQIQNAYYGIHVVDGATFKSCYLNRMTAPYSNDRGRHFHGTAKNFTFIDCKIVNGAEFYNSSSVSFINTILAKPITTGASHPDSGDTGKDEVMLSFDHSVHLIGGHPQGLVKGTYRNSILTFVSNDIYVEHYPQYVKLGEAVSLENSIISGDINKTDVLFELCQSTNTEYRPMTDVFATCTEASAVVDDTYELTSSAKALLSTDGTTERGIYGGYAPYTTAVTYPQFTTFEIAEKAMNGKLNVNIVAE